MQTTTITEPAAYPDGQAVAPGDRVRDRGLGDHAVVIEICANPANVVVQWAEDKTDGEATIADLCLVERGDTQTVRRYWLAQIGAEADNLAELLRSDGPIARHLAIQTTHRGWAPILVTHDDALQAVTLALDLGAVSEGWWISELYDLETGEAVPFTAELRPAVTVNGSALGH